MYLRFKQRYIDVATECGRFNADILAHNGKEIIEVEVKTSIADLRNDMKKKKHYYYQKQHKATPNKFYFAIPRKLRDAAIELTENTPYGIIAVKKIIIDKPVRARDIDFCFIYKRAKPLTNIVSTELIRDIHMRCSSELINLRIKGHV